jgi:hypothetical protein
MFSESYTGGPLNGISITNCYDGFLRRIQNATLLSGTVLTSVTNGFDASGRLNAISDATNSATYYYLANSRLVSQIVFTNGGAKRMTTTKSYDNLNRLTSISSTNASSVILDSHGYGYNSDNQRMAFTNGNGTYWLYEYDSLGQENSGIKYWHDGNVVAGQQFG